MSRPVKILLIEDNPGDVRLVKTMLAESGYPADLTNVKRLSAGLKQLARNDFDVILLDLGLPDGQGFDVFSQIHQQDPQTPIIIFSGLGDQAFALQMIRSGARGYLVKGDIEPGMLVRTIYNAIVQNRQR